MTTAREERRRGKRYSETVNRDSKKERKILRERDSEKECRNREREREGKKEEI